MELSVYPKPTRASIRAMNVHVHQVGIGRGIHCILRDAQPQVGIAGSRLGHSNALTQVWPDIENLSRWPYLVRKAREQKMLRNPDVLDELILPHLRLLHQSQFLKLKDVVVEHWEAVGEDEYAKWFQNQYANEACCRWFVCASGVGGVSPNQNPIESCHNAMKKVAALSMRASTEWVLTVTLPAIIRHEALATAAGFTCGGPIPAEMLIEGRLLTATGNARRVYAGQGRRVINGRLVNAKVKSGFGDNIPVSQARASVFLRSWGRLEARESTVIIPLSYFSLHHVCLKTEQTIFDLEPADLVARKGMIGSVWLEAWPDLIANVRAKHACDCHGFFQAGWVCPHILAALRIVDGIDRFDLLARIPCRKVPRRPPKPQRALCHQNAPFFSIG
ncbi:TPA: hypothetical protein N0F65_010829 [Lagenidium giganteum]|uniref:SWIM-type domain-containing protein n=1 Tax=Lagenidium giganteum TaxID=4803 RepID=A0AAV2Z3J6_9STRA|nr:TPA: hypothetical protein N0F65_010829 [Lagenidium giganteum]